MIIYKFYLRDAVLGELFLGSLPERRKNPKRISDEFIINWGRKYFGMNGRSENIFFTRTTLEENENRFPNLSVEGELGERHKKVSSLNGLSR